MLAAQYQPSRASIEIAVHRRGEQGQCIENLERQLRSRSNLEADQVSRQGRSAFHTATIGDDVESCGMGSVFRKRLIRLTA